MFIPREFIITSDLSMNSEICTEIRISGVEVRSKHTYLASFLLQEREKGRESKWFPYLDILPKDFNNIPLFFRESDLKKLHGSLALQKIQDRHDSLRSEYQNLRRHVHSFRKWSYEDFVWARLVVITRIFGLLINNEKTDGLVPMADMINHRRPRETRWTFSEAKQGFVISAMQDFGSGDQIYDSYGRKCNSRFFVNYGFALENNPDNECLIKIVLPHERYNNRRDSTDFQIPKVIDDKKTRAMFSLLRWSVLQDQSKSAFIPPSYHNFPKPSKGQYIAPISIGNEIAVLQLIHDACEHTLSQFVHTLQDDVSLLQDTINYPLYSNDRNIIIMRSGEKRILHHWRDLTRTGISALQQSGQVLREFMNNIPCHHTSNYMKSIITVLRVDDE